jgi:glycosyltransferase involved in cell wall biosynthesis
MKLLFSVIVPMLNEERVIARCLRALEAQTFPRDRWEVIVVDNGSRDRTLEIAASFAGSLNLTILVKTGVSISAVRNFGARAAQGECLAFLDADCVAPPDWLKLAHGALSANSRRIVGAQYTIPRDSSWVAKAWYGDLCQLKQGPILYVPGGDLIVRRDRFFELSGFDEQIETSEDCDFCQRAAASGTPAVGIAALSVEHLGTPQTLSEFFRKQRWHGSHVFQVFLKDERHIRNARSVLLAFYTLS